MSGIMRLSLFGLLGFLVLATGCASRKNKRQIDALNAQVGVITEELVTLDQGLQDVRGSLQEMENRRGGTGAVGGISGAYGGGEIYRTPSGFELPSMNIQQALKSAGYYQGTLDGKIGPMTKQAVQAFQRDHGLTADGVIGRKTWDKPKVYLEGSAIK